MAFGPRSLPSGADPKKFYACPGCEKTFATKKELKDHLRDDHNL